MGDNLTPDIPLSFEGEGKVEYPSEAREVAYFGTTERLASEKQGQDGSPASSQAWESLFVLETPG